MKIQHPGLIAAGLVSVLSLYACSAGGSSLSPRTATRTASAPSGSARHASVLTVATSNTNCGSCDCSNDPNNNQGTMIPTDGPNACGGGDVPPTAGAYDGGPVISADPSIPDPPAPSEVAVYGDKPGDGQKCGNNPGSGYGYHDNLPYMRNGVPPQVQNVNEVYIAQGFPFNAGGQPMIADTLIGWMYQDQWGYYYFQQNPNLGWYPSVGVSWTAPGGFGVSFAVNAAPNTTAQILQNSKGEPAAGTPHLASGKVFAQCWSSLRLM